MTILTHPRRLFGNQSFSSLGIIHVIKNTPVILGQLMHAKNQNGTINNYKFTRLSLTIAKAKGEKTLDNGR